MKHSLLALTTVIAVGVASAAEQTPEARGILTGHKAAVFCADFSPDGKVLATGSFDGTVRGWDTATGRESFTLAGHGAGVRAVVFSADGKTLYTGSEDRTVKAWDVAERKEKTIFKSDLQVYCLARSPDGKRLAVGLGDWKKGGPGQLKLLDPATGKETANLQRLIREPRGLVFTPNGKTLAAVDGQGFVPFWNMASSAQAGYVTSRAAAQSATFDADGTTLAVGHLDGSIRLWDALSWEEDATLLGHKDIVLSVAFSPDGKLLASASKDGTVRLWDVNHPKKQPLVLKIEGGQVWFALFSPDGKTLATGSDDKKTRLWDVASLRSRVLGPVKPVPAEPVKPPKTGPTRIALVTAEKGEAIRTLVTLAEAKLTESKALDVLDRQTIDKVLAEHKLALGGLVAADQALKVGKLLSVELLAILETSPVSKSATGFVVFDARTGVKLWDGALPSRLSQAVEATVYGIEAARQKYVQQYRDLRTLCILTVRNADLPRSLDPLCDSVGLLLERELIGSPGVAVLERRRLDQVNKERTLSTDATLQQLLASVVVCELEIARTGKGLKATAQLSTAQGKVIAKPSATVDKRDAGKLARALLNAVAEVLKADRPGDEGNRSKEARRFAREAEFLFEHNDYPRALRISEAAYALDPDDLTLRAGLARALLDQAIETIDPRGQNVSGGFLRKVKLEDLQLSAELAVRGAELLLDVEANRANQPLRPGGNTNVSFGTRSLYDYLAKVDTAPADQKREIQPLLENLTGANRRLVEAKLERTRQAVKDRGSFKEYTDHASGWLTQYGMPRNGKTVDPLPVLLPWMETAKRYDSAESFGSYWLLKHLTWQFRYKPKLPAASYEQYRKLWEAMEQHPLPQFRLTGKLGRIAMDLEHNLTEKERHDRIREFRLLVQKEIESEVAKKSVGLRVNLYYSAYDATQLLVNLAGYQEEIGGLCDFMLKRKEVINSIVQSATFTLMTRRTPKEGRQAIEFADRAVALLREDAGHFLAPNATKEQTDVSRTSLIRELNRMRDSVVRANPELAPPPVKPWTEAQEILDLRRVRNGLLWIHKPLIHEGMVYAAVVGAEKEDGKQYVQLLRYDPDHGEKALGKKLHIETGWKAWADNLPLGTYFGQASCIHDGAFYLATRKHGILRFSLDGDSVEIIDTKNGLPSDWARSVAGIGTSLYAGLGEPGKEGYLVRYDLKEKKCDILASSRRKEQLSPFDDASPLEVAYMMADPKRGRVLFTACVRTRRSVNGLWELDVTTGKLKLLQQLNLLIEGGVWGSPMSSEKVIIVTSNGTFTFDLAHDKAQVLYTGHTIVDCGPGLATSVMRKERGNQTMLTDGTMTLGAPYLVHDGWFWAARPFARLSLDGRKHETLASPRAKDRYFEPWETIAALADGKRILVSDPFGLWVLRLSDKK